jgi:hypothetical protein
LKTASKITVSFTLTDNGLALALFLKQCSFERLIRQGSAYEKLLKKSLFHPISVTPQGTLMGVVDF